MGRDRHLKSSTGVRDENYANKHRIHISERVTRVIISVYLDIVQVIRQYDVQVHPLSTVSKTHHIDFVNMIPRRESILTFYTGRTL
jgi:hypothetical protein